MPETVLREPPLDTTHTAPPELERVFAMRRDELRPEVRTYADNLHAQILDIFREHGAKNFADFERIAREKQLAMSILEHAQVLVRQLLEVAEKGEVPQREYVDENGLRHVTVDVDYSRSLADLIAAGKYDRVHSWITEENFPSKKGTRSIQDIVLIQFDNDISKWDALKELDRRGLRPATLQELFELGAQYPNLQTEFPILGLSAIWDHPDGYSYVVNLDKNAGGRTVELIKIIVTGFNLEHRNRFAAVLKEKDKRKR